MCVSGIGYRSVCIITVLDICVSGEKTAVYWLASILAGLRSIEGNFPKSHSVNNIL